ncbi:MAG: SDR family NAD(P)-dependent oxidoreductase [Spirochaetia bacterium]|nr:SDR family NAD(P)-dependent oxidoreductase [Spirochaetia bacterium]
MDLKGKTVLITGGNRGMGRAMVEKFASMDAKVIFTARNRKKGENALKEFKAKGLDVTLKMADMAKTSDVEKLGRVLSRELTCLDVLINSAAINGESGNVTIETIDEKILRRIMEIDFFSVLFMCKFMIPLLKKSPSGRIINFSSGLGQLTPDKCGPFPSYSIAKTAVNSLTKNLANELKDTNIMVFSVDPGWVKTDLGGPDAPTSIEQGIDTPVWLATEDAGKLQNGSFYKERKVIEW